MPNKPKQYRPPGSKTRADQQAAYNKKRGSPTRRGYNHRWVKYAKWFLKQEHNIVCKGEGCERPATEVDHIKRVTGADDPLFWDADNHQGLCASCHSRKTAKEQRQGEAGVNP
jgi:5-methylcytosine-specific restriction protein A